MSSPERNNRLLARRLSLAAFSLLSAGLVAISGCTVQPLYSERAAANPTVTGSIGSELAAISIKPVVNRVGQEVRNDLLFLFYGGKAAPAAPRYTLTLSVSAYSEASATIQVNTVNEPTAAIETVRASYRLVDSTGKVVSTGNRQFSASYDVPRQEFAAFRAQRDAENRAARELAELLRLVIAQDLSRPPAG
jgi:LPS-assembly lipoprotein